MRRRRLKRWSALLAVTGLQAAAAPVLRADEALSGVRLAVAPFESVGAPGAEVPDVATLLADRLGTRGLERVVGPDQLGAEAAAEPSALQVKGWAADADVDAVVVGRTTRIGGKLSVDVRLRSGSSGEVAGTYVAAIHRPEDTELAVDRLAAELATAAGALVGRTATPAVAPQAPPPAAPAPARRERTSESPLDMVTFDQSQPISIESAELEASQTDGARHLVFKKDVVVAQADVKIRSSRLEAFYPPNQSQPDRLVATGSVRLEQGRRRARCDEATYQRVTQRLVCRGNAVLEEDGNSVAGDEIEFDLRSERVSVNGGVRIVIQPEQDSGATEGGGAR